VLAYRDELIGLLKSLDREGMEGARAFYLSAYSGKEAHVYDRIGRGLNIRVEHVCVSMLGSIQPSVIGRYLREAFDNGGGDGLLSRFSLLVWPDVSGKWRNVDRWPDSDSRQAANALFERMDNLEPCGATLPDDSAGPIESRPPCPRCGAMAGR
jgi:putative DNA primase/helicase